jgi:N-acetylglucosamine-6-phosphate deacetylase
MRFRARYYATGEWYDGDWRDGRLVALGPPGDAPPEVQAGWFSPALFDLQINGCLGRNFTSAALTTDDVRFVVDACRGHGIGGLLPTVITSSFETLAHAFATLARACETDAVVGRAVPGFHLEGPYLSPEDGPRGAHPRQHVRPPDWNEFQRLQDAAGGRIRLVTLAPEVGGAMPFIEKLAAAGVVVAIGHTAATGPQIHDAVRAGARLSTHLGNGCAAMLHRHDNPLWPQLAADNLWASFICDGHHLPHDLVQCLLRLKSPARLVLTCDASPLAGMPPGRYRPWEQDLDVQTDGKVVVAGSPYLGGSGVFTDACVEQLLRWEPPEFNLEDALDVASVQPQRLLGLPLPDFEAGRVPDLLLFDWEPGGRFEVRVVLT